MGTGLRIRFKQVRLLPSVCWLVAKWTGTSLRSWKDAGSIPAEPTCGDARDEKAIVRRSRRATVDRGNARHWPVAHPEARRFPKPEAASSSLAGPMMGRGIMAVP